MASRSLAALGKLSRRKVLGDLVVASLKGPLACIHTTSVVSRGKKKVAPRVSKITKMREAGSTEEDIQSFIDNIVKRKNATQEYLSKLETVAEACREELRLQEEERKDVKGEQMRKEAMEREEQARNFALLLKNNDELSRERYLLYTSKRLFNQILKTADLLFHPTFEAQLRGNCICMSPCKCDVVAWLHIWKLMRGKHDSVASNC